MRYLTALLLSFTLLGCGMSPKDMISDCEAEYLPLWAFLRAGYTSNPELTDQCFEKIAACQIECWLAQKEANLLCHKAHGEAIAFCTALKQSIVRPKR